MLKMALGDIPEKVYGYPVRQPYPSEDVFFAMNPNVAGYAAEDRAIVLNKGARNKDKYLSNRELAGVAQNEALRLYMRDADINPDFKLTPEQKMEFQGTAYANNEKELKQSIVARILTGDRSAGEATPEQKQIAEKIFKNMRPSSGFSGFPTSHPFVKNPDGSQSNVKLSSWDIDGKTYVIPTMVGGKELKGKAAVKVAMDYGLDKYPSFSDSKSAEQWIDKYHGKIGEDGKLLE
jgi:hypothetical protein